MTTTVFVLFGATGDLAQRKVLPAFFTLAQRGLLPERWRLIGNGRGDHPHEHFRASVRAALEQTGPQPDTVAWDDLQHRLLFAGGGFDEDDPGSLVQVLADLRAEVDEDLELVHYLALPPSVFGPITRALRVHGLADGARAVYEKPFGTSPESFEELESTVSEVFTEEQVFRIDHFLGKQAVQNLHVLRYANPLFAGIWSRESVAEVQVDVPETLHVANRAAFYDETGALRDMVVTHLLQVAAQVAMEPPLSLAAEDLQTAREAVIAAFRPLTPQDVVLGQYEGYQDVSGVAAGSRTDTFAAARLYVDTDRWHGVPFVLRTGKRMAQSAQQVTLLLRAVPGGPLTHQCRTAVRLSMADAGRLDLDLALKSPAVDFALEDATASVDLCALSDRSGEQPLPAYAALLHDVLTGDRSLFTTSAGLRAAWAVVADVLQHRPEVLPYRPGSWGPPEADRLTDVGWSLGPGTPTRPAVDQDGWAGQRVFR